MNTPIIRPREPVRRRKADFIDTGFTQFVSVSYAKWIWVFCFCMFVVGISASWFYAVWMMNKTSESLYFLVGPVGMVICVITLLSQRLALEGFVVIFRIYEQLRDINHKTK
jgi:hypothetical protein